MNPASAVAQRDYSLSLVRLASLEEETGDLQKALALLEQSLVIGDKLVANNPDNPLFADDRKFTVSKIDSIRNRLDDKGDGPDA